MAAQTAIEILRASAPTLSVGMITADLLSLGSQIQLLEAAGVGIVHFDVMDGVFCPMMTIGPPVVKAVGTRMLKDVHLMIEDPIEKVDAFVGAGADIVTVHVESSPHIHSTLRKLGTLTNANDPARGLVRGVALNPGTPLSTLEPLLSDLELIVLLAVNPGVSGQSFIPETRDRVSDVKRLIGAGAKDVILCVDGGIKKDNVAEVAAMGVDLIVTGSAVFDGKVPAENAREMLASLL